MTGKTIVEMSIGDSAEFSKTLSEADIYLFAGLSGDLNPFHVNEEYAKNTFFKGRIAHGILLAGFIWAVTCPAPALFMSVRNYAFWHQRESEIPLLPERRSRKWTPRETGLSCIRPALPRMVPLSLMAKRW